MKREINRRNFWRSGVSNGAEREAGESQNGADDLSPLVGRTNSAPEIERPENLSPAFHVFYGIRNLDHTCFIE
jgi:hypothetical protein